jgi:hypothetical protein
MAWASASRGASERTCTRSAARSIWTSACASTARMARSTAFSQWPQVMPVTWNSWFMGMHKERASPRAYARAMNGGQ